MPGKSYSPGQKSKAVERVIAGETATAVARSIGATRQTVKRWFWECAADAPSAAALRGVLADMFIEAGLSPERARAGRLLVSLTNHETLIGEGDVDALDAIVGE